MVAKTQLCRMGSAITARSVVWLPISDVEKTGNTSPVLKICHNPEQNPVNSNIIILLTTSDGNINSVRVSVGTELSIRKNYYMPNFKNSQCLKFQYQLCLFWLS